MSLSGGVMSSVALDEALDELGMLSTITKSSQEYVAELSRRFATLEMLQDRNVSSNNSASRFRTRSFSTSTTNKFVLTAALKESRYNRFKPYDGLSLAEQKSLQRRSRTRSENESELLDHFPQCQANQHSSLEPVPYIAFPIDSVLASNLFKSRSMESIDAHDGSGCLSEKGYDTIASLKEVDSVSSGLHGLNVSE